MLVSQRFINRFSKFKNLWKAENELYRMIEMTVKSKSTLFSKVKTNDKSYIVKPWYSKCQQ
jgi:hypothetical protein